MFTGVSCLKNTSHHGLYNFRILCHNAAMSTLCRAKWKTQGIAPPAAIVAAKVGQWNNLEKASPALLDSCPLFNRRARCQTILSDLRPNPLAVI